MIDSDKHCKNIRTGSPVPQNPFYQIKTNRLYLSINDTSGCQIIIIRERRKQMTLQVPEVFHPTFICASLPYITQPIIPKTHLDKSSEPTLTSCCCRKTSCSTVKMFRSEYSLRFWSTYCSHSSWQYSRKFATPAMNCCKNHTMLNG